MTQGINRFALAGFSREEQAIIRRALVIAAIFEDIAANREADAMETERAQSARKARDEFRAIAALIPAEPGEE